MTTQQRALIIGGNGFIGSHLVDSLRKQCQVTVLDVGAPRPDCNWQGVDYTRGAVSDVALTSKVLEGVDVVYHLASSTVPATSNLDPVADIEGNLIATVGLLDCMRTAGVQRIVYFSSGGTVYGNPSVLPIPETHATAPISSYGVVKLAIEKYLGMYQALYGLSPLILRPANPYGPRQGGGGIQGVIAAFLAAHRRGNAVKVWGDGTVVRDYLFVSDLITLATRAAASSATGVFNVGSGVGYSLNEILECIGAVTGRPVEVNRSEGRSFDVDRVVLDVSKARDTFDWAPSVDLSEGLKRTWNWIAGL